MSDLEVLEQIGTDAVQRLRMRRLDAGRPFMINAKELPSNQSYLEYPDHRIDLVTVADDLHSFATIRTLTPAEVQAIRIQFNLLY